MDDTDDLFNLDFNDIDDILANEGHTTTSDFRRNDENDEAIGSRGDLNLGYENNTLYEIEQNHLAFKGGSEVPHEDDSQEEEFLIVDPIAIKPSQLPSDISRLPESQSIIMVQQASVYSSTPLHNQEPVLSKEGGGIDESERRDSSSNVMDQADKFPKANNISTQLGTFSLESFNWSSAVDIDESSIGVHLRQQLGRHSLPKFVCKVHGVSAILKSKAVNPALFLLKVSLQPLPGKKTIVRPLPASTKIISKFDSGDKTSENYSAFVISFGHKSVPLFMTEGDLRSKIYKEGACSRVTFELFYNGETNLIGIGSYYLPGLLDIVGGNARNVLPLKLEIIDSQFIAEAIVVLNVDHGTRSQNLNNQQSDKFKYSRSLESSSSKFSTNKLVNLEILGVFKSTNGGKQIHLDKCNINVVLSGSGESHQCPYNLRFTKSGKPIGTKICLRSYCALIDVLTITASGYGNKDIGCLRLPVAIGIDNNLSGKTVVLKLWPSSGDERTLMENTGWKMVFQLSCSDHEIDNQLQMDLNNAISNVAEYDLETSAPPQQIFPSPIDNKIEDEKRNWMNNTISSSDHLTKMPSLLRSQDGCIFGSIRGIARRKNSFHSTTDILEDTINPGESYLLEVHLIPDLLKLSTRFCFSSSSSQNSEFDGFSALNFDWSFAIAWTLMQVFPKLYCWPHRSDNLHSYF